MYSLSAAAWLGGYCCYSLPLACCWLVLLQSCCCNWVLLTSYHCRYCCDHCCFFCCFTIIVNTIGVGTFHKRKKKPLFLFKSQKLNSLQFICLTLFTRRHLTFGSPHAFRVGACDFVKAICPCKPIWCSASYSRIAIPTLTFEYHLTMLFKLLWSSRNIKPNIHYYYYLDDITKHNIIRSLVNSCYWEVNKIAFISTLN